MSPERLRAPILAQIAHLVVRDRTDDRPHGFYTQFDCSPQRRIAGLTVDQNHAPPTAWGFYEAGGNPISFVVYFGDGYIETLEASSTIGEWPVDEESIQIQAG